LALVGLGAFALLKVAYARTLHRKIRLFTAPEGS